MGRHAWLDDAAPGTRAPRPGRDDEAGAPWDRRPSSVSFPAGSQARSGPLRRWGLRGCLVLVLAGAAVLGFRLASGQATADSLAVPPAGEGAGALSVAAASPTGSGPPTTVAGQASAAVPGTAAGTPPTSDAPTLTIHVVGAVKRPGVYRMGGGSRVQDAVEAAGARRGARLAALNLAAPLIDGTQLHVPAEGEEATGPYAASGGGSPGNGADGSAPRRTASGSGLTDPVAINAASQAELETLPGVGPALAQRIIAFRQTHGRLQGEQDLDAVPGIGPAMLEKLRGAVSYD